jgi:hypothetical protein
MSAVKSSQGIREMLRRQLLVELDQLSIVEVENAYRGENGEYGIARWRHTKGKARSIQEHACRTFASLRDGGCDAGATRKSRKVVTLYVDG